jgi:hypothetical protein
MLLISKMLFFCYYRQWFEFDIDYKVLHISFASKWKNSIYNTTTILFEYLLIGNINMYQITIIIYK